MSTRPSPRGGFTLIELLVVIAVIAILIGILLPSLRHARETGWATVCQATMGQIGVAAASYAVDFREQVWPQFEWAPIPYQLDTGPQRIGSGVMYDYVDNVDKVTECVKNKRRSLTGGTSTNAFGGQTGLNFDYTMVGRVEGVRLSTSTMMAHLTNPGQYGVGQKPPLYLQTSAPLTMMSGILLYVEESSHFNNNGITDGLWGNGDQISQRHFNTGNGVFLDGHARPMKTPVGGRGEAINEPQDLDCNDLYVSGVGGRWVRLEPNNVDNRANWRERPYGWVNGPR
jgi:prepilin-type N-terminal cleavage/methylation domain-containing protein